MKEIYYDVENPGALGGVARFKKAVKVKHRSRVVKFLKKQRTYTLHKPCRKRYNTRPYKVGGIDQQWQADLVEMIPYHRVNNGYKYLLTVIDLFSRYAWAEPIKHKTGKEVRRAFENIFITSARKPERLQCDEGKEFDNRHVQHMLNVHNIRFFTVKSQFKAAVVERFNRTLKNKMWRHFTHVGSYKWLNVLPALMRAYNLAKHRSINMAPAAVNKEVEHELWQRQEESGPQQVSNAIESKQVLKVGDFVRLSKAKHIFDKGYLPNWTEEIFTISRVIDTSQPKQYKVRDDRLEEIDGLFYAAELQKVRKPEVHAIERVIRSRKVAGGKRQYYVKWLGYGPEHNSWVDTIEDIAYTHTHMTLFEL